MAETLDFQLRVTHGARFALEVDDRFPLEGITAVSGPSGCGKTTLLRALAGLEHCEQGFVRFGGEIWADGATQLPPEARRIGFVFQDGGLFPHLTVAGNLRYGARRRDVTQYDAIVEALELGPLMDRGVLGLSGGEARRVALGRALASDPAILFLDEPLSGLDQDRKAELLPYIGRAVTEARVPAIYVTHSRAEIAALADRVMGMQAGRFTGWRPAPQRLLAKVAEVSGDTMRVAVVGAPDGIEASVSLPRMAALGEVIGLGMRAESLMVSVSPPGRSDSLLQLPAKVVDQGGRPMLSVFGQLLELPRGGPHAIGAGVWLSVLEIAPRPEANDSAKNRL